MRAALAATAKDKWGPTPNPAAMGVALREVAAEVLKQEAEGKSGMMEREGSVPSYAGSLMAGYSAVERPAAKPHQVCDLGFNAAGRRCQGGRTMCPSTFVTTTLTHLCPSPSGGGRLCVQGPRRRSVTLGDWPEARREAGQQRQLPRAHCEGLDAAG